MRALLTRAPFEWVALAALALAVTLFTFGSSNFGELNRLALHARWGALVAFAAAALLLALARPLLGWPSVPVYALAGFLGALALTSAAWSASPPLTIERGGTFVVALGGAGAVGLHAAGRPRFVIHCAAVLVGVASAIAIAGLLLVPIDRDRALQASTEDSPVRLEGIGMNPNTAALLYAVVAPLAVWLAFHARSRLWRTAAWSATALIAVSLFASGSRGATVASFVGVMVVVLRGGGSSLRRAALIGATLAVYIVGVATSNYRSLQPEFATAVKPRAVVAPPAVKPVLGRSGTGAAPTTEKGIELAPNVILPTVGPVTTRWRRAFPHVRPQYGYDIYQIGFERPPGLVQPVQTGIFRGSGRLQVWDGALREIVKRPLLGFGFGLEEQVFVDRYYAFEGARPENSYLGWLLQLGVAGTLVFVALGVVLVAIGFRRPPDPLRTPLVAAVVSGLAVGMTQSWVYSVGNIATLSFWVIAALLAGYAGRPRREPVPAEARRSREQRREPVAA